MKNKTKKLVSKSDNKTLNSKEEIWILTDRCKHFRRKYVIKNLFDVTTTSE